MIPGSLPLATPVINGIPQVVWIWDFENMMGQNLNLSGPRSLKCIVSNSPCVALDYPHLHINFIQTLHFNLHFFRSPLNTLFVKDEETHSSFFAALFLETPSILGCTLLHILLLFKHE